MSIAGRLAAGGALVGAVVLAGGRPPPAAAPTRVTAHFQTAGQLVKGNLVQNAGRRVGLVKSIRLADDGAGRGRRSRSTTSLAPLRTGTEATIRIASLSGVANRYVDLQLPPARSPRTIADGGSIPMADTTTAVDLDQLFSLFDAKTRKGLRNVIRGFGASYDGRGRAGQRGLEVPQPVARRRAPAVQRAQPRPARARALHRRQRQARQRHRRAPRRPRPAGRPPRDDDSARSAPRRRRCQAAVGELPGVHAPRQQTFVNLRATLDDLDPLIDESQPGDAEAARRARRAAPVRARRRADVPRPRDARPAAGRGQRPDRARQRSIFGFRDIAVRRGHLQRHGARRLVRRRHQGAARRRRRSSRFQRPYAVDLTGWLDDFSHSGIYDALGSASAASSTNVNAFAFVNGAARSRSRRTCAPRSSTPVATLGQRNRCPGSTERPADDSPTRTSRRRTSTATRPRSRPGQ